MAAKRKVGVIGLGYVGLPVAVAFAEKYPGTVGFDINRTRVEQLRAAHDRTGEIDGPRLSASGLEVTSDLARLEGVDFFIVSVPTPIDKDNRPDLSPLRAASASVAKVLRKGAIVVYESTVYPGVTEEVCGPILEQGSGLRCGVDFKLGYSPERINPGDREHTFERITKVVSGQDAETLDVVAELYGSVVAAGVHRASSIMVAESAKVIENTQRDLNIALMNELAMIFDRLNIDTREVLQAAGTKWNFMRFVPGLVGGHCIGVDPYYLTARAEQLGLHPQVILAGRRINDGMGAFVAQKTIKALLAAKVDVASCRVLVLGFTFKENVPDVRNTRVVSIVEELASYSVGVTVWDPVADAGDVEHEYGLKLTAPAAGDAFDAIIFAVPHAGLDRLALELAGRSSVRVVIDVRGGLNREELPGHVSYWRL